MERQRFPRADRRQPKLIFHTLELFLNTAREPPRFTLAPKPDVGIQKELQSRKLSISLKSIIGPTISLSKISKLSAVAPRNLRPFRAGDGGTTSATGLPWRVIKIGFLVLLTSSSRAKHLALNSEMPIFCISPSLTIDFVH